MTCILPVSVGAGSHDDLSCSWRADRARCPAYDEPCLPSPSSPTRRPTCSPSRPPRQASASCRSPSASVTRPSRPSPSCATRTSTLASRPPARRCPGRQRRNRSSSRPPTVRPLKRRRWRRLRHAQPEALGHLLVGRPGRRGLRAGQRRGRRLAHHDPRPGHVATGGGRPGAGGRQHWPTSRPGPRPRGPLAPLLRRGHPRVPPEGRAHRPGVRPGGHPAVHQAHPLRRGRRRGHGRQAHTAAKARARLLELVSERPVSAPRCCTRSPPAWRPSAMSSRPSWDSAATVPSGSWVRWPAPTWGPASPAFRSSRLPSRGRMAFGRREPKVHSRGFGSHASPPAVPRTRPGARPLGGTCSDECRRSRPCHRPMGLAQRQFDIAADRLHLDPRCGPSCVRLSASLSCPSRCTWMTAACRSSPATASSTTWAWSRQGRHPLPPERDPNVIRHWPCG